MSAAVSQSYGLSVSRLGMALAPPGKQQQAKGKGAKAAESDSMSEDDEATMEMKASKEHLQQRLAMWVELQATVNCLFDSSKASGAGEMPAGIRQVLEKKEGLFRKHMMGKRVNYGGRSVISPDPYITTDQIGVPVFMAKKLTFPESVASFNLEKLR